MKVLLINGSPKAAGCTFTALSEVAGALEREGVATEIAQLGNKPVRGCIDCMACSKPGRKEIGCVFQDDVCEELTQKALAADGLIVGSPVYYAGPNGALCAVLDRLFYSAGQYLADKPAAAVVSCRRGGASASFDRLNKYFTISNMPVVSSTYWNSVHGYTPEQVKKDLEGLQVMRHLGKNMAWLLKGIKNVERPQREVPIATNFID